MKLPNGHEFSPDEYNIPPNSRIVSIYHPRDDGEDITILTDQDFAKRISLTLSEVENRVFSTIVLEAAKNRTARLPRNFIVSMPDSLIETAKSETDGKLLGVPEDEARDICRKIIAVTLSNLISKECIEMERDGSVTIPGMAVDPVYFGKVAGRA